MEQTVAAWAERHRETSLRAILLGVTPEIAQMRWPPTSTLLAVDKSIDMAQAVWPGDVSGKRRVICGDWLALPQKDSSCDVVIGDGSINCLQYPDGFRALAKQISRVLRNDGIFVLRCYIQPPAPDQPAKLFASLADYPSFHYFKFHLLIALQPDACQGVAVNDVYRFWAAQNIDVDDLIAQTGWDRSAIQMMDLYRDSSTIHTFPAWSELEPVLLEFFDQVTVSTSTGCCPIVVLSPRRSGVPE
jgi:SAM-dependent methyltransferase